MGVALQAPQKLSAHHNTANFDCGNELLNQWLKENALVAAASNTAQTFVVCDSRENVVGYYSLANGSVIQQQATDRVRKGTAKHPIPIVLLARLAVSASHQSIGIGHGMLKDAASRVVRLSLETGIRALAVNAKDNTVKPFYLRFGFEESPFEANLLMILLKDLKKLF